MADRDILNNG